MARYLMILVFIFIPACVFGEKIQLQWEPPSTPYDGTRIFQKTARDGDAYDFTRPVADVPEGVTSVIIEVEGEKDSVLKYQWVARAYRSENESANSNEVTYKVVNVIPISPINLEGSYDAKNSVINLTFEQPVDPYVINHWEIYYMIDQGNYEKLGDVYDAGDLRLEKAFDAVAVGETKSVTFRAVAFRRSGVFSADSNAFTIIIDRGEVGPVQNLKINLEIPVV